MYIEIVGTEENHFIVLQWKSLSIQRETILFIRLVESVKQSYHFYFSDNIYWRNK